MKLTAATRSSALALAQTGIACRFLQKHMPDAAFAYHTVTTGGDADRSTPLYRMSSAGVFVRGVEQALLRHEADFAVHSLKDMPSALPEELMLMPAGIHEDPRDCLLTRDHGTLMTLPQGAVVATGSIRRMACLHRIRPDLRFVNIRGNVETRIRIFREQGYDALILAAAGLKRLRMDGVIDEYLDPASVIPACGQGTIAIEIRRSDSALFAAPLSQPLADDDFRSSAARAFLRLCGAGCHSPAGFHCSGTDRLQIHAMYGNDAENCRFVHFETVRSTPEQAAREALARLGGNV